jgi:hypothetical protein
VIDDKMISTAITSMFLVLIELKILKNIPIMMMINIKRNSKGKEGQADLMYMEIKIVTITNHNFGFIITLMLEHKY